MSTHVGLGRSAAVETEGTTRTRRRGLRDVFFPIVAAAVLALTVGAVAVVPATPAAAHLGCTPEFAVRHVAGAEPEFFFRRCGVPDFDQVRGTLANLGRNHCVPVAASDWLVYLADRGARSVRPGPGVADDYARVDQLIGDVATAMGTTGDGGTNAGIATEALRRWFDESLGGRGADYFAVAFDFGHQYTLDGATTVDRPTTGRLAGAAASGTLVIPWIDWMRSTGRGSELEVAAGHATALVSAHPDRTPGAQPGDYIVGFSDPGTGDGVSTAQGPWQVDLHGTHRFQIQTGANRLENIDRFSGPGYSMGFLEGAILITPTFGLFPDPDQGVEDRMTLRRAVQLDETPRDLTIDELDGTVIDIALGADGATTTALLDDGRVQQISHVDGTATTTATIPGATDIVLDDRGRTAAIGSDGHVTILDQRHNPVATAEVPGATGLGYSEPLASFLTYDGPNQELVGIEAIPGNPVRLRRLALERPDGPPIAPQALLSVNQTTGTIGLLEPGTNVLTRTRVLESDVDPGDDQGGVFVVTDQVTLGDTALDGLVADTAGGWYATRAGRIVAFDAEGTELTGNPFAGQPSTPNFEIFQPLDVGTPGEGPHLLPQDAPQAGDRLTLTQPSPTETVGNSHDVTVVLTDQTGTPLADRPVAFAVTGTSPTTGSATTNTGGEATISWTSTTPGDDLLTAWEDSNGNGAHDPDEPAATIETTWTEPAGIATIASLASSANPVRPNQRVTFTTTVTAPGTAETPEGTVQFTSDGQPLGPAVALDDTGTASLTTRSLSAGVHRIAATFTPAEGSGLLASSARLDQLTGNYRWTGNLIRNPGADSQPGSPTGDVVPVSRWNVDSGGFTAVEYGATDPRTGLPFPTADAGPPDGGANFFAGGPDNPSSVAVQIIPLPSDLLASVDAGTATYRFEAWLGGFEGQNDLCEPVVLFTDEAGGPLDRGFLIGGQGADRNNETKLMPYSTTAQVPVGARTAHVALEFSRTAGLYNDGYCDSLVLKIATPR